MESLKELNAVELEEIDGGLVITAGTWITGFAGGIIETFCDSLEKYYKPERFAK
jgi:hypothetical protein